MEVVQTVLDVVQAIAVIVAAVAAALALNTWKKRTSSPWHVDRRPVDLIGG